MKAIIFDAFGTLFKVTNNGSARTIMEKYLVLIGSNTDNDVLESVMRKNDIVVHKVYTSQDLKCYKPNPLFFKRILDDNGLLPQEVLFVGDSITDDILGPKKLGIKTAWVDRNNVAGKHGQDYTITDLNGLRDVLK